MLISSIFWKVSLFFILNGSQVGFSEGWRLLSKEASHFGHVFGVLQHLKVGTGKEPLRNCEVVPFHLTPVILTSLIRMKTASDKLWFKKNLSRMGEAALKQFFPPCCLQQVSEGFAFVPKIWSCVTTRLLLK